MAAIDKMYLTKKERDEFKQWCNNFKPEALKYFYDWDEEWNDEIEHPSTNFPEEIDFWLLNNCPIKFVQETIRDQYDVDKLIRRHKWYKKYPLILLERLFWWLEVWLYMLYDILFIITFTLIMETTLVNIIYNFNSWYNTIMLRLENK